MKIVYKDIPPKLEEYLKIREEVNFVKLEQRIAKNGLENSAYIVSAYDGERLVGLARLISDGGYVNFISDVIVHPKYQLKGIGKNLVEMILEHLQKNLIEGEKIAEAHPNAKKGSGMSLWLEG